MNYYDLSIPSTPPTRGYRLGLWRLRRQRIYRILIALAAILTYILLYLTLKETIIRVICYKPSVCCFVLWQCFWYCYWLHAIGSMLYG